MWKFCREATRKSNTFSSQSPSIIKIINNFSLLHWLPVRHLICFTNSLKIWTAYNAKSSTSKISKRNCLSFNPLISSWLHFLCVKFINSDWRSSNLFQLRAIREFWRGKKKIGKLQISIWKFVFVPLNPSELRLKIKKTWNLASVPKSILKK